MSDYQIDMLIIEMYDIGQVINTSIDAVELALDVVQGDGAGVVNYDVSQTTDAVMKLWVRIT